MPNIDSVQLPDGSNYNIVDNTSNFATQTYVNNAVSGVTKTSIGLGNVDNTSDLSKPVSTAQQTAIDNAVAPKADQTLLAPVESTSTASQTYQIGDQFIYNGLLYKATAVINSGGTITPDGNCELSECITEQIANSGSGIVEDVTSRITQNVSQDTLRVLKMGKLLYFIGSKSASVNNSTKILTLPNDIIVDEVATTNYVGGLCAHGAANSIPCAFRINTSGEIYLVNVLGVAMTSTSYSIIIPIQ